MSSAFTSCFYSFAYYAALFVADLLFNLVISLSLAKPSVPSIGPGIIPHTLTPYGPHSTARVYVMASTPALAAEEWT